MEFAPPVRFGALAGCSDSREVWISFASMPAAFSASSTLPIAALLASDAARAVLASEVTPASICAWSGATDIVASPETEIAGGTACADAGAAHTIAAATAMKGAQRFMGLTSAAHRH